MHSVTCPDVRELIDLLQQSNPCAKTPSALLDHIAACLVCRGALLLFMAHLLQASPSPLKTTCAECQHDLAAYIDEESQASFISAYKAYPHVWWHLWTCADCAQTYQLVSTIRDAEQNGDLVPLHCFPDADKAREVGAIKP
ncbi:MAG: hypothetical protein MI924_35600 [Chloroflexales bacterium]|nr:hypothetical protein [Chloroflexales bacterium]